VTASREVQGGGAGTEATERAEAESGEGPGRDEAVRAGAPERVVGVGAEEEEGPDPGRPSKCPEGCSDNGICNEETGECYCVPSQEGPACASPALPRCQLAPGYTSPCYIRYHLSTCECTQDCQKFRLPVGSHCLKGTLPDGSLNPNLTQVYEGRMYWVRWNRGDTEVLIPDYARDQGGAAGEAVYESA